MDIAASRNVNSGPRFDHLGLSFFLALVGCVAPIPATQAKKTTQGRPPPKPTATDKQAEIADVRRIYRQIQASAGGESWKTLRRDFEYCAPYVDTTRQLILDAQGRPRVYTREAGSEDSSLTWRHYYDTQGRLRFVYITGGAVNGSVLEHRIYLSARGQRVDERHRYTKGPGYTFPSVWPRDQLVTEPKRAYHAPAPSCD